MAGVEENLNNAVAAYGKPVVITETGFASRCPTCEPTYEFPVSAEGQQQFLETLVNVVKNVPGDMGWGVFWWYAEATPTSGLPVWESGRYGLFDQNGNLLPAASVFEQFLPALPGDHNEDGTVDAADYVAWRQAAGTPAEYDEWRANFGVTAGGGSSAAAVPEPATVVLLLATLIASAPVAHRLL
jgi:hypothetical protein